MLSGIWTVRDEVTDERALKALEYTESVVNSLSSYAFDENGRLVRPGIFLQHD